jgi:hypothetical protein
VLLSLYYQLKPLIPRYVQIALRRQVARRRLAMYRDRWPIDPSAAQKPPGFSGWPEGKKFALVITHDVEFYKGIKKCIDLAELEKKFTFKSSFNFLAGSYPIPENVFNYLRGNGFEIGIHGIRHDGNLFRSYRHFQNQAKKINDYLKKWGAVGFRAPSVFHHLQWVGELDIEYDSSTFDTDPFEPQPDGVGTIFPFLIPRQTRKKIRSEDNGTDVFFSEMGNDWLVELPYTLPQDHTIFIIMQEKTIGIWKKKLDWIAQNEGMALLITHPDYMNFTGMKSAIDEYPLDYYTEFLEYIGGHYKDQYWNPLPRELAGFWRGRVYSR